MAPGTFPGHICVERLWPLRHGGRPGAGICPTHLLQPNGQPASAARLHGCHAGPGLASVQAQKGPLGLDQRACKAGHAAQRGRAISAGRLHWAQRQQQAGRRRRADGWRRPPCRAGKKDTKAAKAAKAVKKSQWKKTRKPRYSVVFHRPKTLIRSRDPKFPRVRCGQGTQAAGAAVERVWPCKGARAGWRFAGWHGGAVRMCWPPAQGAGRLHSWALASLQRRHAGAGAKEEESWHVARIGSTRSWSGLSSRAAAAAAAATRQQQQSSWRLHGGHMGVGP